MICELCGVRDDRSSRARDRPADRGLVSRRSDGTGVGGAPRRLFLRLELLVIDVAVDLSRKPLRHADRALKDLVLDVVLVEHHRGSFGKRVLGHHAGFDLNDVEARAFE